MTRLSTNGTYERLARVLNMTLKTIYIDSGWNGIFNRHQKSAGASTDRGKLSVIDELDRKHVAENGKHRLGVDNHGNMIG